jgi:hypothetical protein
MSFNPYDFVTIEEYEALAARVAALEAGGGGTTPTIPASALLTAAGDVLLTASGDTLIYAT